MRTTASGTRALAPTSPTIPTSYTPGPWHEHSHRQIGPDEGIVAEVWSAIGGDPDAALDMCRIFESYACNVLDAHPRHREGGEA